MAVIAAAHVVGDRHAEGGDEPGGAQHPQRVVGEGLRRGGRRAQQAAGEVDQAAEGVGELPSPVTETAIAFMVKSRRRRSSCSDVP